MFVYILYLLLFLLKPQLFSQTAEGQTYNINSLTQLRGLPPNHVTQTLNEKEPVLPTKSLGYFFQFIFSLLILLYSSDTSRISRSAR